MVRTGLPRSVVAAYDKLVDAGALTPDAVQRDAALALDRIAAVLEQREAGGLKRLLRKPPPVPRGLYIWGPVGRGKSMLMDLLFKTVSIKAKSRVHFHEFMDMVHAGIGKARAEAGGKGPHDPIGAVVTPLAKELDLLCFDEFHINDITNAMILQRVFDHLFAEDVVIVATSNLPPDRLYENGLNRQLFMPFIGLLKYQAQTLELVAEKDYRLAKLSGREIFHFGIGEKTRAEMDALWLRLTAGFEGEPTAIESLGRTIDVPHEAMGAARFEFADLCEAPFGARDYLRIAHAFHTIMLDNVPHLGRRNSNPAKRFILLVDTLYEAGAKLAASFAEPLDQLNDDDRTGFEFERCKSRLIEMQSEDYLAAPRKTAGDAIDHPGEMASAGTSIPLRR
jgi:cell division protein ZapE